MEAKQSRSYGNVSHALDILLVFKEYEECTLAALSEILNIRKSYLLKLLDSLKEKGFIRHDDVLGVYQLGPACLELGFAYEERIDLRKVAHPSLVELSALTKELIHFGVMESNVVVLLDRIMKQDSGLSLQFHLSLTSPPYSTGLGKVILAYSDQKIVDDYLSNVELKRFTPHTTIDHNMLRVELDQIRKNGYYLSYETFESGVSCIAAPVFSKDNKIVAAISICAPTVRVMSKEAEFRKYLLETTYKVSKNLGYSANVKKVL